MNTKIYIFILLALIVMIVFVSIYQQKKHTSQHSKIDIKIVEQIAQTKLEELVKDMPTSVTYVLSEGPKEIGGERSLLEFVYSPDHIPYPADGKIRNWSIVIVIDAILKKVEYYKIGDNEIVAEPHAVDEDTNIKGLARESKAGLVVGDILLIELSEFNEYVGKIVIAKGKINYDHRWKCDKSANNATQCFDGPILQNMKYIKMAE